MSRKIRFSKESQSSLNDFFVHRSPEQPKSKAEENLPAGILSAFRTDVGKVRANNQDAPIVSEKLRLYGVADGMGGHKGGEVASTSARDDLLRELEGKTPSVAALSGAIEEVNRQIYHQQEHDDALTGMGTTLSVLWMSDNFVYIGHVGDSRVYLLRDGEFKQMTLDHSLVEQLVREGVLTEEEAQNHPMRNIITARLARMNRWRWTWWWRSAARETCGLPVPTVCTAWWMTAKCAMHCASMRRKRRRMCCSKPHWMRADATT